MSENNTITVTLPVKRDGDLFGVYGWAPRTREEWAVASERWANNPDRAIARAMVEYIDALPENQPKDYGFLGTLLVDGVKYDVIRDAGGDYGALSRTGGDYYRFPSGDIWTFDWSEVRDAGTFTPRSDA